MSLNIAMIKKQKPLLILITLAVLLIALQSYRHLDHISNETVMVMGGKYYTHIEETNKNNEDNEILGDSLDVEKYYRPSNSPVLNDRYIKLDYLEYKEDNTSKVHVPEDLLKSPEDTILNYFSILRDAANHVEGKNAGCGTIGESRLPYPYAYHFLSSNYQKQLSYDEYLKTFENILHMSLVKSTEIPVYNLSKDTLRYFVELETIEGSDKVGIANFAYYYGFVDVMKEGTLYKISNLEYFGENYLCAPMHGWDYDAESVVDIEYGGWCKLVKERYPTIQDGYVKKIYFSGTDGNEYMIEFFQLTNDTDVEIAQYRKDKDGSWSLIKLDPNECLEKDKNHTD